MSIRWITPLLGTAPAGEVGDALGISIVDVRDLVDKAGNRTEIVKEKIEEGVGHLRAGKKTVVCCDYGISRSNAVAAGILARFESIAFERAVKRVQEATGEKEIKLEPLMAVRAALGANRPSHGRTIENILVTGGRGFIGTTVIPALLGSGFQVIAPSREALDIEQGSTQLALMAEEDNIDYVVHLANPRIYTSSVALGRTLSMLTNVINICVARDIPLAYLSGWEVFSGYQGTLRAGEALPLLPRGPYGEAKYLAELLIEHHRRYSGLRCAVIRSGPVYGVGGDKPKFIFNFAEKASKNEAIMTHRYNNGSPALDLMHVDDLSRAICAVVERNFDGVVHVGTGMLNDTYTIANYIKEILGSSSIIHQVQIDSGVACIAMDITKAEKALDWKPRISLLDGLKTCF